jgi:hypothetical protein
MRKPGNTILGFALLGLVLAGASYACAAFYDYNKPMDSLDFALMAISMIICSP